MVPSARHKDPGIVNQRILEAASQPTATASGVNSITNGPSFATGMVTLLSGQIACAVIGVAIEVCYARFLGPVGRGQVSLCLMASYALAVLAGLGGEIPMATWAADRTRRPTGWFTAVLFWGLIGSAAIGSLWTVVFWRWHPSFLHGITPTLAVLVLASMPLTVLLSYLTAALMGQEQFRVAAGLALVAQVAELAGIGILLWLFGRTAEMAVMGYMFGLLIGVVATAVMLRNLLRRVLTVPPAPRSLSAALSFGVRGQLGNLATMFNYRLDVFIVNYFLNPAQVGLYALGVVVSESLWQVPRAAAVALLPRTARTIDRGATEFTCAVTRQVLVISCLSGLVIAFLSPFAIPLVFGERFSPSVSVVWWILPGTVALSLAKVMSSDLAARGKPEYSSICAFLSLAVTVALDLTLIPRMGISGAALASSVAYLVQTVLVAIALKRVLNVTWRQLLVPSSVEWIAYKQAWFRLNSWLSKPSTRPAATETNSNL